MKAAGLNGLPSESFKSMVKYCRRYVFDFINEFWNNRFDFEIWHKSQCAPVPKPEDLSDMKKWRGGMLIDIMSKIFITVINLCCFEMLYAHEI